MQVALPGWVGRNLICESPDAENLLYECGLGREHLSVFPDDTDFFSIDARKLHSLPEEGIFLILVIRRERVLMDVGPRPTERDF